MSAEKKTDESSTNKYKIEDLYDVSKEKELLKLFFDIALAQQDKTWSKHKTKDDKIKVDYKYVANSNLCTIRGQTIIPNSSVEQYYEFSKGGYNNTYKWEKECDKMCTENVCVQAIDIDHEIVYGSYDSGIFVISPRDFCYIKARYKINDYKANDGKLYDLSCTLCYSVDEKYPFYRTTKKKHVRAILKYSGYIFFRDKSDKSIPSGSCRAAYIVYLDPCGWIPTWVVNLVAPDQGMVIKSMLENWPKVQGLLNERKGNQIDIKPMFDKPQPFNGFNDDDNKSNDNNNNDDDEKKVVGGWKEADKQEIFDAANDVKSQVEKQAKEDGKDEFKIFEVIEGSKQVVAGINYKIKVRVGDDRFIQILVFRSLPPISYQLKNVEYL